MADRDDRGPDAEEKIDARGKPVIPYGMDAHCNFDEPSPVETRQGFERRAQAGAAGGLTTVLEHPIRLLPPKDAATSAAKRDIAKAKSVTDLGLGGAPVPQSIEHIPAMHMLGAVAFKAFMSEAGADHPVLEDGQRPAGRQRAAPPARCCPGVVRSGGPARGAMLRTPLVVGLGGAPFSAEPPCRRAERAPC